jgi:hypothetical protein
VLAREFTPPQTAQGCNFEAPSSSVTLATEAEFSSAFGCPEGATSGLDFGAERLRVTVIPQAGFTAPTRHHSVLVNSVVQLGFELPRYCGGAFPPTAVLITVLPSGAEPVQDSVCGLGSCGGAGAPP